MTPLRENRLERYEIYDFGQEEPAVSRLAREISYICSTGLPYQLIVTAEKCHTPRIVDEALLEVEVDGIKDRFLPFEGMDKVVWYALRHQIKPTRNGIDVTSASRDFTLRFPVSKEDTENLTSQLVRSAITTALDIAVLEQGGVCDSIQYEGVGGSVTINDHSPLTFEEIGYNAGLGRRFSEINESDYSHLPFRDLSFSRFQLHSVLGTSQAKIESNLEESRDRSNIFGIRSAIKIARNVHKRKELGDILQILGERLGYHMISPGERDFLNMFLMTQEDEQDFLDSPGGEYFNKTAEKVLQIKNIEEQTIKFDRVSRFANHTIRRIRLEKAFDLIEDMKKEGVQPWDEEATSYLPWDRKSSLQKLRESK